ncbi:hypothetical protein NKH77_17060 [Streptomyces sp. M19]
MARSDLRYTLGYEYPVEIFAAASPRPGGRWSTLLRSVLARCGGYSTDLLPSPAQGPRTADTLLVSAFRSA